MTHELPPTEEVIDAGTIHERTRRTHPAFGNIAVTRGRGSPRRLFGSKARHHNSVTITVSRSVEDRHLANDWFSETEGLIEIEMSESQWARFIASGGMGGGTPCTLRRTPAGPAEAVAMIALDEPTTKERHEQELKDMVAKRIATAMGVIEQMAALAETSSVSKRTLRELVAAARHELQGIPESMRYVLSEFDEAMEVIVDESRTEVEAFARTVIHETGLQAISGHALLVDGSKGSAPG